MTRISLSEKAGGQSPKSVFDILRSIQFDHWIMIGSTPKISLMSHDHQDHNPQLCVSYPTPIIVSQRFASRMTGDIVSIPQDTFWPVGNFLFYSFVSARLNLQGRDPQCTSFHSDWWFVTSTRYPVGILFIGELDYPEVPVVKLLIDYVLKSGRPLNAVLLPSYGGITTHRVSSHAGPRDLSTAIEGVAKNAKQKGLTAGGLPHPIRPAWTDLEFLRLPQKSQIL